LGWSFVLRRGLSGRPSTPGRFLTGARDGKREHNPGGVLVSAAAGTAFASMLTLGKRFLPLLA